MTWSANSGFEKLDGTRPSGITMGEEYYDGWGAKLARVTIKNNLVGFCSRGVMYFGSVVPGGSLDNVSIANNTF